MTVLYIQIRRSLPYFAEIPYYLWGRVNYDSEGNCKKPTDCGWTWIYLQNRETREVIELKQAGEAWSAEGDDSTVARLATFLAKRSDAVVDTAVSNRLGDWNCGAAFARSDAVRSEFEQDILGPFDSHFFWGSWKWIGWYATEFTWMGRWIMHSLVRGDPRAIPLCIDWIQQTQFPEQSAALSYAVQTLSREAARTPEEWVRWYNGGWFKKGAKHKYPQPDFDTWLADLKQQSADGVS